MNKRLWNIVIIAAVAIVAAGSYLIGHAAGNCGESSWLAPAAAAQTSAGWSPTEPYPPREVYFPGTDFRVPTTTGRRAIEPVRDALLRHAGGPEMSAPIDSCRLSLQNDVVKSGRDILLTRPRYTIQSSALKP